MRLNTDGLIIREYNTGEADRLVTVLTRDMGVIRAFVRGARSIKSKSLSSTQLLSYSKLSFFMNRDTYSIDEAEPIEVFFDLRQDIVRLALAQFICELNCELAPEGEEAEDFLRLALNALHLLAKGKIPAELLRATVQLRILSIAGYSPNLVACGECGEFYDDIMYFDPFIGEMFCSKCKKTAQAVPLPPGVITAMRHICYSELERLFSFSLPSDSTKLLADITEKFLLVQTQRKYKALSFYKSINPNQSV